MQPKMIKVDQALHGYSRGHKELASSVELDERSRTTMLMMSDLLAVIDLQSDESYLTVYPLKSASRHVVARTWAAGSNYRPGSVWTHSLILDYQALTLTNDLVSLFSYFEKPVQGGVQAYGKRLEIDANKQSDIYVGPDDRIPAALWQLYGPNHQQEVVLPHRTAERDEILTLAIWRQMWPGMRRDFSALTNLGDGTVRFESGCTLRFTRHVPQMPDISDPSTEVGLRELEADLPQPGPTALRSFLGRYAIEAKEPRRIAASLAAFGADDVLPVDLQLKRIRELTGGTSLPRFVRDLLTIEFGRVGNAVDLLNLVRLARNETVSVDLSVPVALASSMSLDDLGNLIALTNLSAPEELGASLHAELIKSLPAERLARVVNGDDRIRVAQVRPEIVRVPYFWPADDISRAALVEELPPGAISLSDALEIFGRSIGAKTVSALMKAHIHLAPDTAVALLKVDDRAVREEIAGWVVSSSDRLRLVSERLTELDQRAIETLAGAQLCQGEFPDDPHAWAELLQRAISDTSSISRALDVIGYLCALALPEKEGFDVAKTVFDPLHDAARDRTLSSIEERYLAKNISPYSRSWSLNKALVQSALRKWPVTSLQAGAFAITRSEAAQGEMIDEILISNGKSSLEALLRSSYLSEFARAKIQHRLTPAKSKKSSNPWSWLFDD